MFEFYSLSSIDSTEDVQRINVTPFDKIGSVARG